MKNETKRQNEEEEARRKRLEQEAAQPFPELSDEEVNDEIRQQIADAQKQAEADEPLIGSDSDLGGDKQLLETEFLIPNKADEIMLRLSQANTKLIDDDDDDEGF